MALAIFSANLFSSKVLLVKLAFLEGASPLQILVIRMATALPFFVGLFAYLMLRQETERPGMRDYIGMTILGLVGYYASSLLDFHGMQYISAGMERLLLYLYPTFLVLIRSVMERTRPSRNELAALVIAYAGTALVYADEEPMAGDATLWGAVLVLASAVCFANYLYFSSRYIKRFGSRLFASYSSGISCVAILLHGTVSGSWTGITLGLPVILLGFSLGLFCTVFPTLGMHQAISLIGSSKVGMLGTTGIVAPMALGILLFSEPLTVNRLLGTVLVLLAVLVLGRKRRSLPGS